MDFKKLVEEQNALSPKISIYNHYETLNLIGAVDITQSFDTIICSIIVYDLKKEEVIDYVTNTAKSDFPSIKHLEFYRFGEVIMNSFKELNTTPDILLLPYDGILHPRGIGLASQVGLLLDIPTIGVSSKLSCGHEIEDTVYIKKELAAFQLHIKQHSKPVYVSPGHNISFTSSREFMKKLVNPKYKLPVPLHKAHKFSIRFKKTFQVSEN